MTSEFEIQNTKIQIKEDLDQNQRTIKRIEYRKEQSPKDGNQPINPEDFSKWLKHAGYTVKRLGVAE